MMVTQQKTANDRFTIGQECSLSTPLVKTKKRIRKELRMRFLQPCSREGLYYGVELNDPQRFQIPWEYEYPQQGAEYALGVER